MLNALEDYAAPNTEARLGFLGFHLVLPSLECISLAWEPAEHSIALQSGYQITLKSRNHAISILLLLTEVLGRIDDSSLMVFDFARQLLDHVSSLRKQDYSVGPNVLAGLVKFCLMETRSTITQPRLSAVEVLLHRLILLMGHDPEEDLQLGIALCLLRLVQFRRKDTCTAVSPGLRRSLLGVGDQAVNVATLDADFQVRPQLKF